jgi:hypothetical protein
LRARTTLFDEFVISVYNLGKSHNFAAAKLLLFIYWTPHLRAQFRVQSLCCLAREPWSRR